MRAHSYFRVYVRFLTIAVLSALMGMMFVAQATNASEMSADAASAYLQVLTEQTADRLTLYSDLLDMDGDGHEELIAIIIPRPEYSWSSIGSGIIGEICIWQYKDGEAKLVANAPANPGPYGGIFLVRKDNQRYLYNAYCRETVEVVVRQDWFVGIHGQLDKVCLDWETPVLGEFNLSAENPSSVGYRASRENPDGSETLLSFDDYRRVIRSYQMETATALVSSESKNENASIYLDTVKHLFTLSNRTTPSPDASAGNSYSVFNITGESYSISFSQARQEKRTVQVSEFNSGGDRMGGYEPRNITLITLKPGSKVTVSSSFPADYGLKTNETGGETGKYVGKDKFDYYYSGAIGPVFRTETVNWSATEMRRPPDNAPDGSPYYVVMESALTTGHFDDVSDSSPFAQAIQWAVDEGITFGNTATTFNPNGTCTVRHILTFLWRSQGAPEVYISTPFEAGYDDFGMAARWAYQRNLITGSYNDLAPCTRAQAVWYLWTLAGRPRISGNTFSDVPTESTYADAIAWAVSKGITNGFSDGTFRPGATCTRGQIAAFLYRAYERQ